jgi:hypothetical protein
MLIRNEKGEMEQVVDYWESYATGYAAAIADLRRPPEREEYSSWRSYLMGYLIGGFFMWWLIQYLEDK